MDLIEKLSDVEARLAHLSERDRLEAYRDILRAMYSQSLFGFTKYCLKYSKLDMKVHTPIIKSLEGLGRDYRRLLLVLPRGTYKSTIGAIAYPIWRLINNHEMRILIDSEVFMNSARFLDEIKAQLVRPEMEWLFGRFRSKSRRWKAGEIEIAQRLRPHKEASITCSGIGAQKTSQHYDLIIADDLSTPKNTATEEQRRKVIEHYRYYTSLLDPNKGELVVIGTRYHEEDIIGFILRNELEDKERATLPKGAV